MCRGTHCLSSGPEDINYTSVLLIYSYATNWLPNLVA